MNEHILLVEDDEKLSRMVELELKYEGYAVTKAYDGRSGLEQAVAGPCDLVLLDIMLPQLSGMEVLRRLRREKPLLPVIMVTARDSVTDKVSGLDSGADDYITKPFAIEELLARIRVALKRHSSEREGGARVLEEGPLRLDRDSRELSWNGQNIPLTKKEFDLLEYLMLNRGVAVSRSELLDKVWGYSYAGDTNVVDVYIRYLRCKLDDPFHVKLIHTVRGVGYLFRLEEEA